MDQNLLKLTKKFLFTGKFEELRTTTNEIDYKILKNLLTEIAYDNNNIAVYSFINYLILKKENAELHSIASDILVQPFGFFKNTYGAALYHAKRAIELAPNNLDYKQQILFFHDIPDRLLSTEEAIIIAKEIIKKRPDSIVANNLVTFYTKQGNANYN